MTTAVVLTASRLTSIALSKAAVRAVLQAFKIEPTIFAVWMRILARVPHSTLYMLRLNEGAAAEAQVSSNIGHSLQPEY